MSTPDNSPNGDRLRELFEEINKSVHDSARHIGPSLRAMVYWHCKAWEGHDRAGILRNNRLRLPASRTPVGRRVEKACRRFRKAIGRFPYEPSTELELIAEHIAHLIADIRKIRPFEIGNRYIESLLVHASCWAAGVGPPDGIGDDDWEKAIRRWRDKSLPSDIRREAFVNLLARRIRESTPLKEMTESERKAARTFRGRRERRQGLFS